MKRYYILLIALVFFIAGCGIVPTYPVPQTLDIGQVIAETAAVEMTKIAETNAPVATEVPAEAQAVESTPTPEPLIEETVEAQRPKDIALLLGTISMEPGSVVFVGEQFHITWRIRNIGETVWNDSYSLVYTGGEAFGQDVSLPLSVEVAPGDIIDLTLILTAPENAGIYRGEWLMVAPDGTPFGVGYEDQEPLVVDVVAEYYSREMGEHLLLLMYMNYSAIEWRDQYGPAFCSATGNVDAHGLVTRQTDVIFEGKIEENEPTLVMRPAQGVGGFVEGKFPPYHVTSGNYFTTYIGCMDENKLCDVSLKIYVQVVGESSPELYWEGGKVFDGKWIRIHQPLEKYRGDDIIFIFRVENNGDSTGDVVGWFAPVILH